MYTVSQLLQKISSNRNLCPQPDLEIYSLAYDTRKIRIGINSLFFALIGQRDGHQYITDAYHLGVRSFVVSATDLDIRNFPNANFIWVEDTLAAIQQLAAFHRNHFEYPIIGITGSNGKTVVKEWLYSMLSQDIHCYQSPKSYNSQLGVAISLWGLDEKFDLALIEAGVSMVGEMQALEEMIKPTLGIFTSMGNAHDEGFISADLKIREKWKLFQDVAKIYAPSSALYEEQLRDPRLICWGIREEDMLQITDIIKHTRTTEVSLVFDNSIEFVLVVPFIDTASIDNVLTCALVLADLGIDWPVIQKKVDVLGPLEMRLKLKKGRNNISIIDDTYSNDVASLQIALDFLAQQNQHNSKKVILSDIEGQRWDEQSKSLIVDALNRHGLDEVVLVGNRIQEIGARLNMPVKSMVNTDELIKFVSTYTWHDATILIKGARMFQLERISNSLVEKSHETVLEINLNALEHNLNQYRAHVRSDVKIMAMVKAFSYGSGSFEVANILQFHKIDYLTVAFVDEGVELRRGGISLPIMVLSPHESSFDDLVRCSLEPEIYSLRILKAFVSYIRELGLKNYPIHIKIDTGMHRLGFMENDLDDLFFYLKQHDEVRVVSTFSHLVGAGSSSFEDFTHQQINLFRRCAAKLEAQIGYSVVKHICNTSGIIHHPEAHLDMVRLGIGLYGYDMAPKNIRLNPVSKLKTTISQIKYLKSSETIGYDRKGILSRDSVIATVKIGYADGYDRRLGNGVGKMRIHGHEVPTIGNICMDMCMLDITGVQVSEGDEVEVFPNIMQTAIDIGNIPYELLTGISSRVKRVYFYE